MSLSIYRDSDIDRTCLNNRVIAIVGYGAQGQAHALNLRDSGCDVRVGQRGGGRGHREAIADGFSPQPIREAVKTADVVCLMIPDEHHGDVFAQDVAPVLKPGAAVLTCHGFSFHYRLVVPPATSPKILVAPKGQGHMVRGEYLRGGGVPCLVAAEEAAEPGSTMPSAFQIGLAYAAALGGGRAGVIPTSIAAETETDLFGEQAVLCGGLTQLIQAGFDTLVDAGYQPELAYFECLHELKIIIDLLQVGGIAHMRDLISTTAEYGDVTRGPQIIDQQTRQNMRNLLREIQAGKFAREFLDDQRRGGPTLERSRRETENLGIEHVGQRLRKLMPWLQPPQVPAVKDTPH